MINLQSEGFIVALLCGGHKPLSSVVKDTQVQLLFILILISLEYLSVGWLSSQAQ